MTDKEDEEFWQEAVRDVRQMPENKIAAPVKQKKLQLREREETVPLKLVRHDLTLGTHADIDGNTMRRFKRGEFPVEGVLDLLVPTYRVDVTRPCDVAEEILRVYGYDNVEFGETMHSSLSYRQTTDVSERLQYLISEQLTACGFYEIMNNSLTAVSYYEGLQTYPLEKCVRLMNPLSNDLAVLRQTLVFGGLESLAHNINRKKADLMMYEFGHVYSRDPEKESSEAEPLRPFKEETNLGLWMTGDVCAGNWALPARKATVYDLKSVVENIFARIGLSMQELSVAQTSGELFDASLAYATKDGKTIGQMGIVSRKLLKMADIHQEVFYAELKWDVLLKLALRKKVEYRDLPKTMPVKRDLALLLDAGVTFAQVENVIRSSERKLLKDITLFDVYEGKNLEAGKKSYAVSLILQDEEKTLNDKQIDAVMNKIIANLQKQLDAKLR